MSLIEKLRCYACGSADLKRNRKDRLFCVKCKREQPEERR